MSRLSIVPRSVKRALAALLVAGALATPLFASPIHSTASHTAQGALAMAPRGVCPGSLVGC